jgi:hypothetical protein
MKQYINPDVQNAIDCVGAMGAELGHRLGAFAIATTWRRDGQEVTVWAACCPCSADAEALVCVTRTQPGGPQRISLHGPALELRHDEMLAQPQARDGRTVIRRPSHVHTALRRVPESRRSWYSA